MTVSTTNLSTAYTGDGVTDTFSYDFTCLSIYWVRGFVNGIEVSVQDVTVNTDQSASPGGFVTFTQTPLLGDDILIARDVDLLQETDYPPYTRFPAESHEDALDKLTLIAQQQSGGIADLETNKVDKTQAIISGTPDTLNIPETDLSGNVNISTITNVANGLLQLDDMGQIPPGLVDLDNTFFPGSDPDLVGFNSAIGWGNADPETELHIEGGPTSIQAKTNGSTVAKININPLGGGALLNTATDGINITEGFSSFISTGTDGPDSVELELDGGDARINIKSQDVVILETQQPSVGSLAVRNDFNGTGLERVLTTSDLNNPSTINIIGETVNLVSNNAELTESALLQVTSDYGIDLRVDGILRLETNSPGNGSLFVNNLATGAGMERVLTTSDLGGGGGDFLADGSVPMTGNLNMGAGTDELKILFDQPYTEKAMLWGYDRGLLMFPTDASANPVGVPWINCASNAGGTNQKVELYTHAGVSMTTIPEGVRMHDRAYVNRPDTALSDELTSKQYVDSAITSGIGGAGFGDMQSDGSVPMTGTLTINDSGDIIDAGNLIVISGAGGVGVHSGSPGNYHAGLELGIGSSGYARIREGTGTEAVVYCNANKVQLFQSGSTVCAETATPALGGLLVNNLATGAGIERALTVSDLLGEVFIGSQAQNALIHVDPNTESVLINSSQDWQAGWEAFKVVPDVLNYDGDPIGGVRISALRLTLDETTTPFPDEDVSDFNIGEHTARNTKMAIGGLCAAQNGDYASYSIDSSELTLRSVLDSDSAVGGRWKLERDGTTWNELEGPAGVYTRVYESTLASAGGLLVNNQATGAGLERVLTASDIAAGTEIFRNLSTAITVTNTTVYAPIADFSFPVDANSIYRIEGTLLHYQSVFSSGGGLRVLMTSDQAGHVFTSQVTRGGVISHETAEMVNGSLNGTNLQSSMPVDRQSNFVGTIVTDGNGGTISSALAQITANADGDILGAQSNLRVTKIA